MTPKEAREIIDSAFDMVRKLHVHYGFLAGALAITALARDECVIVHDERPWPHGTSIDLPDNLLGKLCYVEPYNSENGPELQPVVFIYREVEL